MARQPPVGHGLLIHEISRSHTTTHHIWYDSSGRVISSSQRPLPDNTRHSQRRDLYLTTHDTHNRHPSIHAPGEILDRAATGIGTVMSIPCVLNKCSLYTNIRTNKYCKFILKLLRHVSALIHRLQGFYSCVS